MREGIIDESLVKQTEQEVKDWWHFDSGNAMEGTPRGENS